MATHSYASCICYTAFIFMLISKGISGSTFTFKNRCNYMVWPGILSSAGSIPLDSTGFELSPGESRSFQASPGWSGRFWGRTGCNFDSTTGQGSCATADCGSNQISCNGAGATPPATLAEFTLGGSNNPQDFYDVSLVDGYNLPMTVDANGGTSGVCGSTGCVSDLNRMCPAELRAIDGQACKSACEAFGNPEYCCSGSFGSPDTCRPSVYSQVFKSACPRSYSYAYDDASSTFTCTAADYTITFCPTSTSQKSSNDPSVPTSTGTGTNASPIFTKAPEPEDDPNGPSWMPSFTIGGSPTLISNYTLTFTLISFFCLCFFQL